MALNIIGRTGTLPAYALSGRRVVGTGIEIMAEPPGGTVTFLLTDVEGSTALWENAPEAMRAALARHDSLFEQAVHEHRGVHVRPRGEGDSRFAVFASAPDALAAALAIQRAFAAEDWPTPRPIRVRIGVHTGEAELRDGDYYGSAVNRCARLRGIGHGGQSLVSEATAALSRDALPAGASLLDLGDHRLRDLTRPERVFQVVDPNLSKTFLPLASLDARPHNLPLQVTSLLGRAQETQVVQRLLLCHDVRLVTLTGPGGTGKTRLGLQVAADLLDRFEDGAFFVELAPIVDPDLVPSTIAQVLGVRDVGGPVLDSIVSYLRGRRLLLVLDNFEQVVSAATVVAELLRACPGLSVLVTSRAPLQIGGEHEYPVPPLALPDPELPVTAKRLTQYAAVALFVERAVAVKPDFAVTTANAPAVAEICHRLDGLPLSLELAAARVRLLTPEAMLSRLGHGLSLLTGGRRDLPARQRTLRNAIAWSYDLLDVGERRLFRRLGVFVGGFTLGDTDAVCTGGGDLGIDIVDGLEALVSRSLVRQRLGLDGEPRLSLLETIREFALDQLAANSETSMVRRRHAECYLVLAEEAAPHLELTEAARWLDRLQAEHDNLRAALAWSSQHQDDPALLPRLAGALWSFWWMRGHFTEGRRWLDLAIARPVDLAQRITLLHGAGQLAFFQGDFERAEAVWSELLSIGRTTGDGRALLVGLGRLSFLTSRQGDHERAVALADEGLELARHLGDKRSMQRALHARAQAAVGTGDYAYAESLWREGLVLMRELGLGFIVTHTLHWLARMAIERGDLQTATTLSEEAVEHARTLGDKFGLTSALGARASAARRLGDHAHVVAAARERLQLGHESGNRGAVAEDLESLAFVARVRCDPERGARLLAAADRLRNVPSLRLPSRAHGMHEAELSALRTALGAEAFASAWADGRAMTLEQAVAYALDEPPST